MAVDVPGWTLYGSTAAEPQGCRDRMVGGPALAALRRNRVPVAQGDPFPRHGARPWPVLVAMAAVGLGATALLATRLRRRIGSVRP